MLFLEDTDLINALLNDLAERDIVEPIDDPTIEMNFWDWADVVGIVDEFCPEYDVNPFEM